MSLPQHRGLLMPKKVWIRLVIMIPIVIALAVWANLPQRPRPDPVDGPIGTLSTRPATSAEWQQDIATLGAERLAKQLTVLWIRHDVPATFGGRLVWYHDGSLERLAYLAAADEEPSRAMAALMVAVDRSGHAQLYAGFDPSREPAEALARVREMPMVNGLPPGWTVLTAPPAAP